MTPGQIRDRLRTQFKELETDPSLENSVFCYRDESNPATIFFVPLTIIPETGGSEKPQFNLFITGATGMLQLGCRWDADRRVLKQLEQALLQKLKPEGITSVNFSVPYSTVKEMVLEIAGGDNLFKVLQSSSSSGYFPYTAIFNIMLDKEQKDQVLHTLNGTGNYMRIRCMAVLQEMKLAIEPECRIVDWFAGTNAMEFITISPGAAPVPGPSSRPGPRVILHAPAGIRDTPVNFLQIVSGNEKTVMSPPGFEPVNIPGQSNGNPIHVVTQYTDGGSPFETDIQGLNGNEYTLQPPDLGLAEIDFDAASVEAQEATSCRVHIMYKPSGRGSEDERTVYLKPGKWREQWYVCSRDKSLQGELSYDVKIIRKDGSISKYQGTSLEPVIHFNP